MACPGGPGQATAPRAAAVTVHELATAQPPDAANAPGATSGRRGPATILAAAAVAIAGISAGVVVAGGGDGGHAGAPAARTPATAQGASPPVAITSVTPTVVTVATTPRSASRTVPQEAAIEVSIVAYFRAVRAGSFDRAWQLLSPTYRSWKTAGAGGFTQWRRQETRNRERLRGGDAAVRVQSYDAASHVATVYVSGLRFKPQGRPECSYEGVTWARRVGGRWLYDQGYMQNPARATKWRPRRLETLGSSCDTSGY